jgi:hypothetical protein
LHEFFFLAFATHCVSKRSTGFHGVWG